VTFFDEQRRSQGQKQKIFQQLPVLEFIHAVVCHIPPKQFKIVRYYGLYAPCKAKKLRAKMGRLAQASGRAIYRLGWRQRIRRDFKRDPWCCPLWASPDGIIHFDDPLRPPQVIKRWPQMVTGPGRIVAVQDPDPPPVQLQPLPVQLGFAFLRSP
jgi:hypothetical protein